MDSRLYVRGVFGEAVALGGAVHDGRRPTSKIAIQAASVGLRRA